VRSLIGTLAAAVRPSVDAAVPFVGRGMAGKWGGRGDARGQREQLSAMGGSAALFSIVNRTTTAVAKETWHLGRDRPGATCEICEESGSEHARGHVPVPKHPALTVLDRPNGHYTTQEYFESGQQHVDLTGEGWTIISRFGQMPAELWVARPDRMVVVTDRQKFLVGYIYVDPDGQEMPIRKEDVLSIRMPNPNDPYRGMGAVQTVLANVDSGGYSAEWNANFFRNGARPGGIVKLSRSLDDTQFEQLVERFNLNHRGVANANRTAFLEDGDWVDVKPMNIRDMQFVETAEMNRDMVLLAFTASKFDVGILQDVNRAASEAARADFGLRMTVPRLDRWRAMLNNDFLPQFPGHLPDTRFYYSNPVPRDRIEARDDKKSSAEVYEILRRAGVEPDVAAEVAGLPPMALAKVVAAVAAPPPAVPEPAVP
jgi:HK97 family phage portal protein